MRVVSAKENEGTIIGRPVIDSVIINENVVSTGQAPDAHVASTGNVSIRKEWKYNCEIKTHVSQLVFSIQRY